MERAKESGASRAGVSVRFSARGKRALWAMARADRRSLSGQLEWLVWREHHRRKLERRERSM